MWETLHTAVQELQKYLLLSNVSDISREPTGERTPAYKNLTLCMLHVSNIDHDNYSPTAACWTHFPMWLPLCYPHHPPYPDIPDYREKKEYTFNIYA